MKSKLKLNYSIHTNKGLRAINEDASWIGMNKSGQYLAIVCDGIGSQDDSQIASLVAVEVFAKSFEKKRRIRNCDLWFKKTLRTAYNRITELSKKNLNSKKIGTTLLLSIIEEDKARTFNLGDTRLYWYSLNDNMWSQVTRDHNLYNYFLDLHKEDKTIQINELCAKHKDQLLALTRCLESGTNSHLHYDVYDTVLQSGDVLFLATDGVYHYIKNDDISAVIKNNSDNFASISKTIIQKALDNKSNDNLTSIVIEFRNSDGEQ
ncbi:MAG: serine/threonine-protein phosphatase [Mycoplasmataceae bacterium]|nr:serine/threonine-protein phosphatase [Mycoplasmataceae bacterium]